MKPIHFPESNVTFAKDQPQYQPLPACVTVDNQVTSCWSFTWRERFRILIGRPLFISVLTFGGPLQPINPDLDWKLGGRS